MNVGDQKVVLGFKRAFPDEQNLPFGEYLAGCRRHDVLMATTYLATLEPMSLSNEENNKNLANWLGTSNSGFYSYLEELMIAVEKEHKVPVIIISPILSLFIFEYAFDNLTDDVTTNDDEFPIRIIKACLSLNDRLDELGKVTIESVKDLNQDIQLSWFCFCNDFYKHEFANNYPLGKMIGAQIVKAVHLFEFLSGNATKWLLDNFLQYYGHTDWREYLKDYLSVVILVGKDIEEGGTRTISVTGPNYDRVCAFLDKFILDNAGALDEYDFKSTRSNPIYKIDEGKYRVIYDLFLVEKIYTGLYFKLSDLYKNAPSVVKTLGEFRGFYTTNFSENYLLYKTMQSCFPRKYIHITGKELKEKGLSAEPDYYVRHKNKIFLIENKDVLIAANIKQSCDYAVMEPEIKKRFYVEVGKTGSKNGAVLQLINNIKLILTDQFSPDKAINKEHVKIYPILVLYYNQYNTLGLNQIIDRWFQTELNELYKNGINVRNVEALTIIDIDTLLLFQDYIISGQINLAQEIQKYSQESSENMYGLPFSKSLMGVANKKGLRSLPSSIVKAGLTLFDQP